MTNVIQFPNKAILTSRGTLLGHLVSSITKSPYTEGMDPSFCAMMVVSARNESDFNIIQYDSDIRKRMANEYGLQRHTTFLTFRVGHELHLSVESHSGDLLKRLEKYDSDVYPDILWEGVRIAIAALAVVLNYPGSKIISSEEIDDVLRIRANIQNDKEKFGLDIVFDILPFILDYQAMVMNERRLR